MKILLLTLVLAVILLSGIVNADHIEYCKAEIKGMLVNQNIPSGQQYTFCNNDKLDIKAVVSMTGLIQMPAELKLYSDGQLIETKIVNPSGNLYTASFENPIYTPTVPRDPQINITISAGCDPTPDSMSINYTTINCQNPISYTNAYWRSPYCNPQYMENYRCNGNWLQRLKQNTDCSNSWEDWQYCKYSCSGTQCLQKPSDEEMQRMEEEREKSSAKQEFEFQTGAFGIFFLASLVAIILVASVIFVKLKSKLISRLTPESF